MCKLLKKIFFLFLTSGLFPLISISQQTYDEDFTPPMDMPLYLTGTFGELRSNHFHAGIDIKTQGKEGLKVRSIGDGWVSRIKISTGGYGKALYITHPNGFVSVYGHLQRFNDTIQAYIKKIQYNRERFEVEVYPDKGEIKVSKGEIVAISGNTGGSMGPHLHFEIREEATQYPVNPLLFKSIKVKDFYRPKILEMAVYPVDEQSFVNGKQDTLFLEVSGWGEQHRLKNEEKIKVFGNVSFGILTYDVMNDLPNKNGVYEVKLYDDTTQVFGFKQDKLSFATSRYINSLIDYNCYIESKKRFVRTQIDTNNVLANYQQVSSNGIYQFNDTVTHNLKWQVTDAYGNLSQLKFEILKDTSSVSLTKQPRKMTPYFVRINTSFDLKTDQIELNIPSNAFYQSFYFEFNAFTPNTDHAHTIYQLHNNRTPVQKQLALSLVPDSSLLLGRHMDKVYLAYSTNGKDFYSVGGKFEDGRINANIRNLGYYTLMVDTILPSIEPKPFAKNKSGSWPSTYRVVIDDKETGIKSYRATLNDKWVLMEYDAKKDLIFYEVDDKLKSGENKFHLEVVDNVNNKSTYDAIIKR